MAVKDMMAKSRSLSSLIWYPGTSFVMFLSSSVKKATSIFSLNAISCKDTMPSSLISSGSGMFGNVPLAFFSIFFSCFLLGNGNPSGKRPPAATELTGEVETSEAKPKRATLAMAEKRIVVDPRMSERI